MRRQPAKWISPCLQVVPPRRHRRGGCLQSADHKCITVQINVTMCNAFTLSLNREFKLQVPLASGGPVSPKGKCLAQPLLLKTNQPSLQYASANACHCSKRSLIQQLKQNRMWIINWWCISNVENVDQCFHRRGRSWNIALYFSLPVHLWRATTNERLKGGFLAEVHHYTLSLYWSEKSKYNLASLWHVALFLKCLWQGSKRNIVRSEKIATLIACLTPMLIAYIMYDKLPEKLM